MATPERWKQIEQLYHAALNIAPGEREQLLEAADPDLRGEVESLLAQEGSTETRIGGLGSLGLGGSLKNPAARSEPRQVGPYMIEGSLGAGGMGEVFRASDTRLGRAVAIKFCDPRFIERFAREAKAISALNHPNICTLYDVGPNYLVMELIEGQTLAARIRQGPLAFDEVVQYGAQIAGALAEAHAAGIVHRDLKPGNVMISKHGVKVLDFGLAKVVTESTDLTATQAIMGTPAYMAPEQVKGKAVDPRTDLFALGLVLYEMATGRLPFPGASLGSMLASGDAVDVPPASRVRPGVPTRLQRLIQQLIESDPSKRPATAASVRIEIEHLPNSGPSRRTLAKGVIAAGALLAGGGGAWWLSRDRAGTFAGLKRVESLAVLPLKNLSGDPEQEFFSDGMTEELIGELAHIESLRVISRTSVMPFRDSRQSLPEIAKRLNVDAIVEGSIQRMGNRVRISAQLIDARDDRSLWSGKFERESADVLDLQADIATAVASQIRSKLTPSASKAPRPVNPVAHEAFLLGVYFLNRGTENVGKAKEAFERAIALDPGYAKAHGGLAEAFVFSGIFGLGRAHDVFPKAKAAALKALQLDEKVSEGYLALADVKKGYEWDLPGAEPLYQRALALSSSGDSLALAWYADHLGRLGRPEDALPLGRRMVEIDPLAPLRVAFYGWLHYRTRNYDVAIEWIQKAIALDPNNPNAHWFLAHTYEQKGEFAQAIEMAKKAAGMSQATVFQAVLGHAYGMAGDRANALKIAANLKEMARTRYVEPIDLALVYAGLGDRDPAFEWLEKAYVDRNTRIHELRQMHYSKLRPDPRFAGMIQRIGLPKVQL